MVIVDSNDKLEHLNKLIDEHDCLAEIIPSDYFNHPCANSISLVMIQVKEEIWVVSYNHPDLEFFGEVEFHFLNKKYVVDSKNFYHYFDEPNVMDVNLIAYLSGLSLIEWRNHVTNTHEQMYRQYRDVKNCNHLIPLSKHLERVENLFEDVSRMLGQANFNKKCYDWYNGRAIKTYSDLEKSGITTNNKYLQHFPETTNRPTNGLVYSEYNLYTSTGRPSNRYGGVNFAALKKEDGTRESFTSRYEKGSLVSYDYDAYHIRLIGEQVGYDFKNGSIHEELGKFYFNKSSLTKKEYEESKKKSFQLLYGGIDKEYLGHEFFKRVDGFVQEMWKEYKKGVVEHPVSHFEIKNLENPNPQKVFNYWIQHTETTRNTEIIRGVLDYLANKKTKLIMYTYDSFLLDFDMNEGVELLKGVKEVLEQGNYPTKVMVGKDYSEEVNITNKLLG